MMNTLLLDEETGIRIPNHNQTLVRPIPGPVPQHNQTMVRPAPALFPNHNQTLRTAR